MAKVLIIGSGAREHALAWKFSQSKHVQDQVYCSPGNPGMANIATLVQAETNGALITFAKENQIDLTVVGSEDQLALAIVDDFRLHNLRIVGPKFNAAFLETNKHFTKGLLTRLKIPTPAGRGFGLSNQADAHRHIEQEGAPIVIKANGPCQGKGVFVCATKAEAHRTLDALFMDEICGKAGLYVIIEKKVEGHEASIHALVDTMGNIRMLPSSKDYKRQRDGERGLMTGGMGAISPAPVSLPLARLREEIFVPVVEAMQRMAYKFDGVLYAGLMIRDDGSYNVLEFNVRFGDPECQALLMRLKTDFYELMSAVADGTLDKIEVEWDSEPSCAVVLATEGYPEKSVKDDRIYTITDSGIKYFYGAVGTVVSPGSVTYLATTGGRAATVAAIGQDSRERVYGAIEKSVSFRGAQYRKDIGT